MRQTEALNHFAVWQGHDRGAQHGQFRNGHGSTAAQDQGRGRFLKIFWPTQLRVSEHPGANAMDLTTGWVHGAACGVSRKRF